MLEYVMGIRFPTVAEAEKLLESNNITTHEIMCTDGEDRLSIRLHDDTIEMQKLSREITHASTGFHPVFLLYPDCTELFTKDTLARFAILQWRHGRFCDWVCEVNEPTSSEGLGAMRLSKDTYIATSPAAWPISWKQAQNACGDFTRYKFVCCPCCGMLHQSKSPDTFDKFPVVIRCRRCGHEFVASPVDRVGVLLPHYQGVKRLCGTFPESNGIALPMRNGGDANDIVCHWPANTRTLTGEDIHSAYEQGQSVKFMLNVQYGVGWNKIDEPKVRALVQRIWKITDFSELNKFLRNDFIEEQ